MEWPRRMTASSGIYLPQNQCAFHTVFISSMAGDVLCLGKEEVNENSHEVHKDGKEIEETKLHTAKHGEEGLSNDKGEQHVDGDVDGLPGRSDL